MLAFPATFADADVTSGPDDPTIGVRSPGSDPALVGRAIDEIAAACRAGNAAGALAQLGRLVPEFAPEDAAESRVTQ